MDENETIKDVMHQESVVAVDVKKVRIYAQQINHLIEKEEPWDARIDNSRTLISKSVFTKCADSKAASFSNKFVKTKSSVINMFFFIILAIGSKIIRPNFQHGNDIFGISILHVINILYVH